MKQLSIINSVNDNHCSQWQFLNWKENLSDIIRICMTNKMWMAYAIRLFQNKQGMLRASIQLKVQIRKCVHLKFKPVNRSAQSEQSLRFPPAETFDYWLPIERPFKTLIRLCEWAHISTSNLCWISAQSWGYEWISQDAAWMELNLTLCILMDFPVYIMIQLVWDSPLRTLRYHR